MYIFMKFFVNILYVFKVIVLILVGEGDECICNVSIFFEIGN